MQKYTINKINVYLTLFLLPQQVFYMKSFINKFNRKCFAGACLLWCAEMNHVKILLRKLKMYFHLHRNELYLVLNLQYWLLLNSAYTFQYMKYYICTLPTTMRL